MIPSDFIARLRLMNDSLVQPLAAVREISSNLPQFQVGQRFVARIEAALPDGNFRALVDGRSLTLSLAQPAQPGETLELVVLDRTPGAVVAARADNARPALSSPAAAPAPASSTAAPAAAPRAEPAATLSPAGRIISHLLSGEDGAASAAPAAQLQRAAPLLPQPAPGASQLAPALRQAIEESGLFYEAHQAQWIAGRRPLETLQREPQGRHGPAPASAANPMEEAAPPPAAEPSAASAAGGGKTPASQAQHTPAGAPPAELQPLVQRQLDAAATQQIVWRGEIWPGQTLHWEIQEEQQRQGGAAAEEAMQWRTSLRLVLPQLGEVSAALSLTPAGVGMELSAADGASAEILGKGRGDLSGALAAAGVPLLSMKVVRHEPA